MLRAQSPKFRENFGSGALGTVKRQFHKRVQKNTVWGGNFFWAGVGMGPVQMCASKARLALAGCSRVSLWNWRAGRAPCHEVRPES